MRVIINHLAGMTDRYAHLEYTRLYFPPVLLVFDLFTIHISDSTVGFIQSGLINEI